MLLTGRPGTADSIPGFLVPGVGPAPTVETLSASTVSARHAILRGTINPNGLATSYYFEYWEGEERPAEPSRIPAEDVDAGEGTDLVLVTQTVTGLARDTTYSFRLVALNEDGEGVGAAVTFFTRPSRVAVTQELPPDQLAVRITTPGGQPFRWAEDEPKAENVLSQIRKSGQMPGGHKEATGTLYRDPREDWPDLAPYSEVVVEQPGGNPVWEGRLDKAPEVDGQRMSIQPAAVGHANALSDRKGLLVGFINAALSAWSDPSTQRRVNLGTSTRLDATTTMGWQGTGEKPPGIDFDFRSVAAENEKHDRGEATFNSGGPDIGVLLYHFVRYLGGSGSEWFTMARLSADAELEVSVDEGTNHEAATNSSTYERLDAEGSGRRYATFTSDRFASAEATLGDLHGWEQPKVLGNQELTLQGTWPEVGFTASQMLGWAIPEFSYLEANAESLDDDGFIIPHAWFSEPTELQAIVKELTKYGLYDWFVLNGKLFELRKPGTYGRKWQASVGPSELQEAGVDGSRLWRTIVVRWTDVDGTTKSAGPRGSGCTVESANLEITDPNHPAVQAGMVREDVLDLQGVSEAKFATQVGERWLKEANELSRSGEATLKGYAMDDKAVFRPVAQVMPGDQIRFVDAGSSGTDYRRIVQVDYDHDQRECKVTLEAPKETYEALLERYRAKLSANGLGT